MYCGIRGIDMKKKEIVRAIKDLTSKDVDKRIKAAIALGNSGKDGILYGGMDQLIISLHDNDAMVRSWSAASLGKFGAEAKRGVSSLVRLLDDHVDYVVKEAILSIKKIDPTYHGTTREEVEEEFNRRQDVRTQSELWDSQSAQMNEAELYEKYYAHADQAQKDLDEGAYYGCLISLDKARFWAKKLQFDEGIGWIKEISVQCEEYLQQQKDPSAKSNNFWLMIQKIAYRAEFQISERAVFHAMKSVALDMIEERLALTKKYRDIFNQSYGLNYVTEFLTKHGKEMILEWLIEIFNLDPTRLNAEVIPDASNVVTFFSVYYLFNTHDLLYIKGLVEKQEIEYVEGNLERFLLSNGIFSLIFFFKDIIGANFELETMSIGLERTLEGSLVKYYGGGRAET